MNQYICASIESISTHSLHVIVNGIDPGRNSYCGIKCLCGDWGYVSPQKFSREIVLLISIVSVIVVVNCAGSIVVPTVINNYSRAISPNIDMQVDTICDCACTWKCTTSKFFYHNSFGAPLKPHDCINPNT